MQTGSFFLFFLDNDYVFRFFREKMVLSDEFGRLNPLR